MEVKSRNLSNRKYYYNPPEGSSIRQLVQFYFDKEVPDASLHEELRTETNPRINVFKNTRRMNLKGKWNNAQSFDKEFAVYDILAYMKQRIQERELISTQHVLPFIKQIIHQFQHSGGKVILYSSTVGDKIPKNVCQQFDFQRDPKMPILHIDSAFFSEGHEPYQFYTMCKFQMLPTVGTPEFVRHYFKPAETPLELRSPNPTEKEREYLAEVKKQAAGRFNLENQMDIYCAKFYLSAETENEIRQYAAQYGIPVYVFCQIY